MEDMSGNSAIGDLPAAYRAALWDAGRESWGMPGRECRGYYELTIYVPEDRPTLVDYYRNAAAKHNVGVMTYVAGGDTACDAGVDLYVPETQVVAPGGEPGKRSGATLINHQVRCCMRRVKAGSTIRLDHSGGRLGLLASPPGRLVGYYLYPRSSMATKTPLRLANSVGIIDAGYRGDVQAAVDVQGEGPFTLEEGQRIVQICPPSLADPVYVVVTTDPGALGETARGGGGFGSTGK